MSSSQCQAGVRVEDCCSLTLSRENISARKLTKMIKHLVKFSNFIGQQLFLYSKCFVFNLQFLFLFCFKYFFRVNMMGKNSVQILKNRRLLVYSLSNQMTRWFPLVFLHAIIASLNNDYEFSLIIIIHYAKFSVYICLNLYQVISLPNISM